MSLARFVVWAPRKSSVTLMIKKVGESAPTRVAMERDDEGWWCPAEPLPDGAGSGEEGVGEFDYGFLLEDSEIVLPDPRSRRQPDGVHGWSRTFDADEFVWSDQMWTGRQLAGGIIYELHDGRWGSFSLRSRPTRPKHQNRTQLSLSGRDRRGDRRSRHLRLARGHRKTVRRIGLS